jgi:DNA-binding GntR family transcriptional regulator
MDVSDSLKLNGSVKRSRLTANEMVQDALRMAILRGHLAPGTRLVQADIAASLEVSTTPVREALIRLAASGLIEFDQHRGAVVHEIDLAELEEIYEIRMALEVIASRRAAARITDEQLDQAAGYIGQMAATNDPGVWVELNWQFHSVVEQASSSRLASVIKTVQNSAILYIAHFVRTTPMRMKEANLEHELLLDALRHRDGDAAAKVTARHLQGTLDGILRESAEDQNDIPGSAIPTPSGP